MVKSVALVHQPIHVVVARLVRHVELVIQNFAVVDSKTTIYASRANYFVNNVKSVLRQSCALELLQNYALRLLELGI